MNIGNIEKELLSRIVKFVSGIDQNVELIEKNFQKFLDVWAEVTKDLLKILEPDEYYLRFYQTTGSSYFLKIGENKIYDKICDEKFREISVQEIPKESLIRGISWFLTFEIKYFVEKLEKIKRKNSEVLNFLKGVLLTYETEKTKKAVVSKPKQLRTLKI